MKLRRLLPTLLTVGALSLAMTACTPAETETPVDDGTQYTIGVAVIVAHPALQAVQDGFEEVLKEQGVNYTLVVENAQGDPANAVTIASSFADNEKIDLMLAISTPIAQAISGAETERPILFSAVTDPVDAGLVPSWEQAGANITGTSDLNPGAKPVALVKEAMPDATTVGVLYSTSEANSLTQLEQYKAEAAELGITIKEQGITSANEVTTGLEALGEVDAILIPTDNTVVAAISTVVAFGEDKQIPVFCADNSTIEYGTVATRGLSYKDLGRRTGEMAVEILRDGKPVSEIAPEATTGTELMINSAAAAKFGLTLSPEFIDSAVSDFAG